jgi:plastocyanin
VRRALIFVIAAAAALAIVAGPAIGAGKTVKAKNFEFVAKTVTIQRGDKVTWKDVGGRHTVTFKTLSFDKTISANRPTVSKTFRQRGTFRYFCRFHRSFGMTGKVIVQ